LNKTVTVSDIKAAKGEKKQGLVKVAETSAWEIRIPVIVINGVEEGPTLALAGGIHPTEYTCIEALIRLSKKLDPKQLKGCTIIIPVMNTPGFQAEVPDCPIDKTNLNREIFPGDPEGTVGKRIAYFVTNEVLSKSDYFIEGHGANLSELCPNHLIYIETGNQELDQKSQTICKMFRTKYVRAYKKPTPEPKYTDALYQALRMGKPSALIEAGSVGGLSSATGMLEEKDINWVMDGLLNLMRYLGMLEGKYEIYNPEIVREWIHVRAKHAGIFYPIVPIGSRVSKGDLIGEIRNFFGDVIEEIRSPLDGITSLYWYLPPTDQGDYIIQMFKIKK
jgi:hypothetical protein